ncbi:MAG: type 1 glutamine amidotransferase [Gammaproteobacteria bacterium]|nr:type 1 glutamine amidotransferase [Gammaproteobacteria bacterium]
MKRIGVLVCDDLHEALVPQWGTYLNLFERLLDDPEDGLTTQGFRVHAGEWPLHPNDMDGWIVTGSRASVHEASDWVISLMDFVRQIDGVMLPLVGVCFGHQLIHAALGGKTARAKAGWQLGSYPVSCEGSFAGLQAGDALRLLAVHQDMVVQPAPGFTRLAASANVPWYASARNRVLTVQGHPEFDREFFFDLMEQVRPKAGDVLVDQAIAGLPIDDHSVAVRKAIRQWFRN